MQAFDITSEAPANPRLHPGDRARVALRIHNRLGTRAEAHLRLDEGGAESAPPDWLTLEPSQLGLDVDASARAFVQVAIPEGASEGDYAFHVLAGPGPDTPEQDCARSEPILIPVRESGATALDLSLAASGPIALKQGDRATVELLVHNRLAHPLQAHLRLLPSGFESSWLALEPSTLDLEANGKATVAIGVTVPEGATLGRHAFRALAGVEPDASEQECARSSPIELYVGGQLSTWAWMALAALVVGMLWIVWSMLS